MSSNISVKLSSVWNAVFTLQPVFTGILVCFFIRMTMRVGLVPRVAVSQTAPRL